MKTQDYLNVLKDLGYTSFSCDHPKSTYWRGLGIRVNDIPWPTIRPVIVSQFRDRNLNFNESQLRDVVILLATGKLQK